MDNFGNIVIYQTEDGMTKLDVRMEEDTVWLTQEQMAELFQKSVSTINEHVNNIYKEGELCKNDTMRTHWGRSQWVILKGEEKEPAGYAGSGCAIVILRRYRLEIVVFSSVHSLK